MKIAGIEAFDVRFPTSDEAHGSDAMHTDPDYSAAYVVLRTDEAQNGYGFTFTLGRGTEVCIAAVHALAPLVVGLWWQQARDERESSAGALAQTLPGERREDDDEDCEADGALVPFADRV